MAQGVGGRLGLVSGVNHWLLYDTNNNIAVYGGSDGVVALVDTTLKLLNRQQTGNGAASADERRAKQENNIRSRASLVINVFAFFLAVFGELAVCGYPPEDLLLRAAFIDAAAAEIAVLQTGNTSLGITLLANLVREAAARLGSDWDIEITEMHHRHKVDAP